MFVTMNIILAADGNELENLIKTISTGLMTASVKLVELDFSNNANGPRVIQEVLELLASYCCISLKRLTMSQLHCGPQCVKSLIDALKVARLHNNGMSMNLEEFKASANDFGDKGIEMLSEFLANMTDLHTLDLSDNDIGIEGLVHLVASIKDHSNLKILKLSHNNLASGGMKLLSDVLQRFKHLEEVDLGYCQIDNDGMYYLTNALPFISNNLAVLSIEGNQFHYLQARKFITMLTQSKSKIKRLDFRNNTLSKWQVSDLQYILASSYKRCVLLADDENSDDNYEENINSDIPSNVESDRLPEEEYETSITAIPETITVSLEEMHQVSTLIIMNTDVHGPFIEEMNAQSGTVFDGIVSDIHVHDVWDPGDLL